MNTEMILKYLTLALFICWNLFWSITGWFADKAKTKTVQPNFITRLKTNAVGMYGVLLLYQLFVHNILPFSYNSIIQLCGFGLVLLGIGVSIAGRVSLGTNWTHATEYQIKHNHELVVTGIYKYIRHPIYSGLLIANTGAELVLQSYLWIPIFIIYSILMYHAGKREEELLIKHFGKKYSQYMLHSKMFIPYIF